MTIVNKSRSQFSLLIHDDGQRERAWRKAHKRDSPNISFHRWVIDLLDDQITSSEFSALQALRSAGRPPIPETATQKSVAR